jgi:hypothetical protein
MTFRVRIVIQVCLSGQVKESKNIEVQIQDT